MKYRFFILSIFFSSVLSLAAKDDKTELAVTLIPTTLSKGANSVVRNASTLFVLQDKTTGTEIQHKEITILNEKGMKEANFWVVGDQYKKLKQFSAVIYNAAGKEIKKYKKSDVVTSQWSQNLTSDDLNYLWSCPVQPYPFTVVYDYEMGWKNGIVNFPVFQPQEDNNQAIQKASYTLQVPVGTEILTDANKFISSPEKSDAANVTTYQWKLENISTFDDESLSPPVEELYPLLLVQPKQFYYDGYDGSFESIKTMGDFTTQLNKGRNTLNEATKAKLLELTKDAANDKEKVKILYDYLGKNTRYESIQLGIGGWQPMTSGDVCKNGYGDCKGLTFYLKSMLEAVGIPSNYTIIRSDEDNKSLKKNFTAFLETNHVILQVPLPNDTLWLECTNTQVPFGFVHNNIAGHNAVVVTPAGAIMEKLPDYPDSLNVSSKIAKIQFKESEPTEISVKCNYRMKEYDDVVFLMSQKQSEQVDLVRETVHIPSANISQLTLTEEKSSEPQLNLSYHVTARPYGSSTGKRYFLPLNVFRNNKYKLRKGKRTNDIVISNGWKESDSIDLELPDNTEVEYLPTSLAIHSVFGDFQSKVTQDGQTIHICQQLLLHEGRWSPDNYTDLVNFFDKIRSVYKDAIVVKGK